QLTLSTNCYLMIDSTFRGAVTRQGNMEILKTEQGLLVYRELNGAIENDTTERMYNTVTTAQGAQYQVVLPDGTKVRLNAASSIRFPVAFSGNGRYVQVSGEAFFEVAPNRYLPFYVLASDAEMCFRGTSFNVEAYSANVVITLINGSLTLKSGRDSVLLRPAQEAVVRHSVQKDKSNRGLITVSQADTAETLSWKKTIRVYKNIAVRDFVQDVGRWYSLEIVNADCVPAKSVSTKLCYDAPVADVLKLLHQWGLQFKTQGNKIIFFVT
ncbi:MAG TPA: FecR domain-containing protein, partial [Pedobacter sp.]